MYLNLQQVHKNGNLIMMSHILQFFLLTQSCTIIYGISILWNSGPLLYAYLDRDGGGLNMLLARPVDIIKHTLTILKLQGLEWKQHAYRIPFL